MGRLCGEAVFKCLCGEAVLKSVACEWPGGAALNRSGRADTRLVARRDGAREKSRVGGESCLQR